MRKQTGCKAQLAALLWVIFFLPLALCGSQVSSGAPPAPSQRGAPQNVCYLFGRVIAPQGDLIPGAEVTLKIGSGARSPSRLKSDARGEFELSFNPGAGQNCSVMLVAKKEDYLDATESIEFSSQGESGLVDLVLREQEENPRQLSLSALIRGTLQRLRPAEADPPKTPSENSPLLPALAFLDGRDSTPTLPPPTLNPGREPNSVARRTLAALVLLKAGSWSGAARQLNEAVRLNASMETKDRRPEPNLILGVLECWRGNAERAAQLFKQALEFEPDNPLLLQELGRASVIQKNWSAADGYLSRAINKGAGTLAHLLRAEAFLGENRPNDAQTEMQAFLEGGKPVRLPRPIRMWWIDIDRRKEIELAASGSKPLLDQPLSELVEAFPELRGIEAARPEDDLASILQNTGDRVEALFRDFHNTSSREQIRQERLGKNGKVKSSQNHPFQYLLVAWPEKSRPGLEEYRTDLKGGLAIPPDYREGFMLTSGFASVSARLLPDYQDESRFVYLGRQRISDRETFVVAFAQRPESARLATEFYGTWGDVALLTQGFAWIDCDSYQILRLRTELLYPVPKVRLQRQTTDIQYAEVHFKDIPFPLWLPREVAVTVDWRGAILRNTHAYSDFRLFNVESKLKILPAPVAGP